jgi:hypothetical protein
MRRSAKWMLAAFLVAMVSLIFAWELRFQRRVEAPMSLALTATRRSTEINKITWGSAQGE